MTSRWVSKEPRNGILFALFLVLTIVVIILVFYYIPVIVRSGVIFSYIKIPITIIYSFYYNTLLAHSLWS